MKRQPVFTPIDISDWSRGQMFCYFSKAAPTGYSITTEIDVTHLRQILSAAGKKFFPAYLWLVTKNLNRWQEFRIAEHDGKVGYYDYLTPLYASFHDDDKTFSLMWTEFDDDFSAFYDDYIENKRRFGDNHGVLSRTDMLPPPDAYTVSCIPWVTFSHFAVHSYENKGYYFPSVEAGKFVERDGRTYMPLSLTCHHASTDGYHVSRFLEALRSDMESFEKLI